MITTKGRNNMTTLTITRKSRVGFSWTNSAEWFTTRNGEGRLEVRTPSGQPMANGPVRAVAAEYERVARLNKANDWASRWVVWSNDEWVAVNLRIEELWRLLDGKLDKEFPTNSIQAQVV